MALTDTKLGEREFDKLFAGVTPAALVASVKVAKGTALKRGTVLTGAVGGELAPVAAAIAADATAYVLADDTTETDTVAVAYKTGNFSRQALVTDGTYELVAADYEALRKLGIQTEDTLPKATA